MRETETELEQGRGRERGRHRIQSRFQAPSCQHRDWRRAPTHTPWDHDLSEVEVGHLTDWATQASPHLISLIVNSLYPLGLKSTICLLCSVRGQTRSNLNLDPHMDPQRGLEQGKNYIFMFTALWLKRKQAPGSEPSAQSLTRGSNSRTARSWPEPRSDAQPTAPPRRP